MLLNFCKSTLTAAIVLSLVLLSNLARAQRVDADEPLEPITIAYTINLVSDKYGNATLGKIETVLSKVDGGYAVSSATKAQGIAAILLGSNYQEACNFSVEQGRAVSNDYSGGRRDLSDYQVSYDWQRRKITFKDGENNKTLDMPQGYVVDNCNMMFAAALLGDTETLAESLYIVDGKSKRIRGYRLKSSTAEMLSTDFGEFATQKVVFERELKPERTLTFWLSPKYSYVPLKMVERRRKRTTTFLVDAIES
jgi:hypothetical protein